MADVISSSSYSVQEKWLNEIAAKYFPVDDLNMLKVGLFGYVNEVMATSVEDSIHMTNILGNEIFPNKAVLPNSIYAYSALAAYDKFNAAPASIPFILAIKKSDILKWADDKSSYKEFRISKESTLTVESKYPFKLDYDIRVIAKPSADGSDYVLTALYDMDVANDLSDLASPYIKSMVLENQGVEFLFMRLIVRQISKTTSTFTAYSTDVIENLNYTVKFDGKLAGFNVYYKSPTDSSYTKIAKYFVDSLKPTENQFCFYSYSDENTIEVMFSAHPSYFKPEFGSQLVVEVITTLGADGNFTYGGNSLSFAFGETSFDATVSSSVTDFSSIVTMSQVLGDSTGGADRLTMSEIKEAVIQEFSSRGNIITETDIKNYFTTKTKNCNITFIKKRDDIIKRMFSAFVLMRDSNGQIIPTNTGTLLIKEKETDNFSVRNSALTIVPGRLFKSYDLENNVYSVPDTAYSYEELKALDMNPDIYLLSNPLLIKINTDPHFISYYLNSVFDTHLVCFKYINKNVFDDFMLNNVNIVRNAVNTKDYKITATVGSSLEPTAVISFDDYYAFKKDLGNLKCLVMIKEDGKYTGYFEMAITGFNEELMAYNFEATLTTNDDINDSDKLCLTNCVYALSNSRKLVEEKFYIGNENVQFDMCILYNGYTDKNKTTIENFINGYDNYCLTNIYETENSIQLFKNLNGIMDSTVVTKIDSEGGFYYKIKSVPMVNYLYLQKDANMKEIVQLLDYNATILSESIDYLENNYSLDMKFYNTYGKSKFFTIGSDGAIQLNALNLTISFAIKVSGTLTTTLVNEIKAFIVNFIEATNDDGIGNRLYMSNLTRRLEENFSQIVCTEFLGINNYDPRYQVIEGETTDISTMTKEQLINFIPEYLNVAREENPSSTSASGYVYEPKVNIKFI